MDIRSFTANDIAQCAKDFIPTFNSPPWNEGRSIARAEEYITDTFNHPNFIGFIMTDGSKNVAYAMCYKRYWWSESDKYQLYVELFFVCADSQHKGYGSALMNHMIDYAKQHDMRSLVLLTKKGLECYDFYHAKEFADIDSLVFMSRKVE